MFRNGYYKTGVKALDSKDVKLAFKNFLACDETYRKQYLQKSFSRSIDGYSYLGQKDSLNQYDFDQLHSFVLSRFNSNTDFPSEFQDVLNDFWDGLLDVVVRVEKQVIEQLKVPSLKEFYQDHIGHMMSANYYPPAAKGLEQRLSAHKDVSLLTVFPFGVDGELKFKVEDRWITADASEEIIVFPGYLMECITGGSVKAVDHKVDGMNTSFSERFSFAIFSIPVPAHSFQLKGKHYSSEDYMKEYLSLF